MSTPCTSYNLAFFRKQLLKDYGISLSNLYESFFHEIAKNKWYLSISDIDDMMGISYGFSQSYSHLSKKDIVQYLTEYNDHSDLKLLCFICFLLLILKLEKVPNDSLNTVYFTYY